MAEPGAVGLRYKDRVTIVTGGGRGIGKGIVETFVKHGSKVVIAEIDETCGVDVEKTVNATGPGEAMFVQCDVRSADDVKKMVEQTVAKFGRIDCVINNAGTARPEAIDEPDSVENYRKLNEINVVGNFNVSKYALPHLRKVKGNIVMMTSMTGQLGTTTCLAYATTKAAQIGFVKTLAIDEAVNGVRVNGVAPACIRTELFADFLTWLKDDEGRRFYEQDISLMGRPGTTHEVGLACLFLAADATYCTGTILNVSGGAEVNYGVKYRLQDRLELK